MTSCTHIYTVRCAECVDDRSHVVDTHTQHGDAQHEHAGIVMQTHLSDRDDEGMLQTALVQNLPPYEHLEALHLHNGHAPCFSSLCLGNQITIQISMDT